jgi:hypothetical protein
MKLPANLSEHDVLAAIEHAVRVLGGKFTIPGHDQDDVSQEIRLMALDAIPRYRPDVGPLINFLVVHCRLRLTNLLRDKWRRSDSPCHACKQGRPCREDGQCCEPHRRWQARQDRKAGVNLAVPLDSVGEADMPHVTVDAEVEGRELFRLIDEIMPIDLRATYLSMLAGKSVPTPRRRAVEKVVRDIIDGR